MAFNKDQFLNTTITDATSDEYIPTPEGIWGPAICTEVSVREGKNKEGETFISLESTYEILDESIKQEMGVDRNPRARYGFILDFNEQGALKTGKGENVRLGKQRTAHEQNEPGQAWTPMMLKGTTVPYVHIVHTPGKDGEMYANVKDFPTEA